MLTIENFKPPEGLDLKENAANNLKNFKQTFEIFITAISEKEIKESRKVAMLLNCMGSEALDVYNTFEIQTETLTTKVIFEKFNEYVKPRVNIIIERHKFHTRRQQVNEPFDSFLTDLRKLGKSCEFGDQEESLIRDRIVTAVSDEGLQQRLLRDPSLTIIKAIETCRAAEMSKIQQKSLKVVAATTDVANVDAVKKHKVAQGNYKHKENQQKKRYNQERAYDCKKCGRQHARANCSVYGKICKKCGKQNHFAVAYRVQSKLKNISEVTSTEGKEFWVDSINSKTEIGMWTQQLEIGNNIVNFKLDTGADCNILPWRIFKNIKFKEQPAWDPVITTVVSYTNDNCKSLGTAVLDCKIKDKMYKIKFIILDVNSMSILGLKTCIKLHLISQTNNNTVRKVCERIMLEEKHMSKEEFLVVNNNTVGANIV